MSQKSSLPQEPQSVPQGLTPNNCGVSISLWAELVKQGTAPKPIELSKRVKVWDRTALDNWIDRLGQPASDGFGRVQ